MLGQLLRYISVDLQIVDLSKLFLKSFKMANDYYYKYEYVEFNRFNKFILSRINVNEILKKRKNLFQMYLNNFDNTEKLFHFLEDNIVPLGFPIVLENREITRSKLMFNNVFCPVHWSLPSEITKDKYNESIKLSSRILTIPLNRNMNILHQEFMGDI